MPGDHALLSPSGADRWLHCPPSARLTESYPDTTSIHAAAGTLAHSIAELKVRAYTETMTKRAVNAAMKPLKADPLYAEEMQGYTNAYLEYIKGVAMSHSHQPQIMIERQVDLGNYVPESFGRCDCLILAANDLHVIDFKYGQGHIVNAEHNPQMMLYALGAMLHYGMFYAFERVHLTIFQPRVADGVKEWTTTPQELLAWAESIKPIARQAFAGEGEYADGDWCGFCPAKGGCRKYSEANIALLSESAHPAALLSDEEIGYWLDKAKPFAAWLASVEEYALSAILRGRDIPGWKAVEGRSNREFTDQDGAFKRLIENGIAYDALYERKAITLANIEKLLGKADFERMLSGYVVKPKGRPTLAPAKDKREPYDPTVKAADVF